MVSSPSVTVLSQTGHLQRVQNHHLIRKDPDSWAPINARPGRLVRIEEMGPLRASVRPCRSSRQGPVKVLKESYPCRVASHARPGAPIIPLLLRESRETGPGPAPVRIRRGIGRPPSGAAQPERGRAAGSPGHRDPAVGLCGTRESIIYNACHLPRYRSAFRPRSSLSWFSSPSVTVLSQAGRLQRPESSSDVVISLPARSSG
jgi:hypothetical protein